MQSSIRGPNTAEEIYETLPDYAYKHVALTGRLYIAPDVSVCERLGENMYTLCARDTCIIVHNRLVYVAREPYCSTSKLEVYTDTIQSLGCM